MVIHRATPATREQHPGATVACGQHMRTSSTCKRFLKPHQQRGLRCTRLPHSLASASGGGRRLRSRLVGGRRAGA